MNYLYKVIQEGIEKDLNLLETFEPKGLTKRIADSSREVLKTSIKEDNAELLVQLGFLILDRIKEFKAVQGRKPISQETITKWKEVVTVIIAIKIPKATDKQISDHLEYNIATCPSEEAMLKDIDDAEKLLNEESFYNKRVVN